MNRGRLLSILSGQDRSATAALTRAGLTCIEPMVRLVIGIRNALFDLGIRRTQDLGRPTISIGNLTTGGTGKTPMVIDMARRLRESGQHPAVLLRGYLPAKARGQPSASVTQQATQTHHRSDEATEHIEAFDPPLPVGVDGDRVRAARRVLEEHPQVTTFILDDGFQHRRARRDVDIVLIDATQPFGFGHVLPRGLMREPMRALRRADAIIVTRCDRVEADALSRLDARIEQVAGRPPVAHVSHAWSGWKRHDSETLPLDALRDEPVVALCGIGNPQAFVWTVTEHVGRVTASHVFDDHEPYDEATRIQALLDEAHRDGAAALVTTGKDWVKLRRHAACMNPPLPIVRPQLSIRWHDGEDAIRRLLPVG